MMDYRIALSGDWNDVIKKAPIDPVGASMFNSLLGLVRRGLGLLSYAQVFAFLD